MASTDEKVECPVCGFEVGTKENGTKIKAHKVDGEKCDGSDELVSTDAGETDGIDKGSSYEAQDSAQGSDDETDDQNDGDDENGAQTATQGVATSSAKEFTHTVSVRKPCPYLGDQGWHVENGKMAYRLATKAGHVPTAEAKHTGTDETETHVRVTYSVPVK